MMRINKGYGEHNITINMYNKIEVNPKNSFYKIGYVENDSFKEVARWRNSYNKQSSANYGLLQIWCDNIVFSCFKNLGGRITWGGYEKAQSNLFVCLYKFKRYLRENEIYAKVDISSYSIDSYINNLRDILELITGKELLIVDCNG